MHINTISLPRLDPMNHDCLVIQYVAYEVMTIKY